MSRFVIAAYTPKDGQQQTLRDLVARHHRVLRERQLVTERPAYLMQAADGTIVEVFEWASPQAIERAHSDPVVQAMWEQFARACEYRPLGSLAEAQSLFAEFTPL